MSASPYRRFKYRAVTALQRHVVNPLNSRNPGQVLIETTGRVSGQPRRTPVGGSREGSAFWLVSEHGELSQYVRNIRVDPRVRVRLKGRWYPGTAHPLPDDDPRARLRSLPRGNGAAVTLFGTDLLTVRVDLDADSGAGADPDSETSDSGSSGSDSGPGRSGSGPGPEGGPAV